jgi:hypothetical protein
MKIGSVLMARNDGYGENLEERASYCINAQLATFDEVTYVDWNSQSEIGLVDAIRNNIPKTGRLHYIKVTKEDHSRFVGHIAGVQNVVTVLSRNVGLRRNSADIIACVTIDIIPPRRSELLNFIATHSFDDTFYTVGRRDVWSYTPKEICGFDEPTKLQTHFAEHKNEYGQHGRSGLNSQDIWSLVDCCGDFQIADRKIWYAIRGYEEVMVGRGFDDSNAQRKVWDAGYKIEPEFDLPVIHIGHTGGFGGNTRLMNDGELVVNFAGTTNTENWGFANETFYEEII